MNTEQCILVQNKAREMRRFIVDMVGKTNEKAGHLGGSSSAADIVATLYFYKMKTNPQNPKDPARDRFLLSKGHAALVQYAALALKGFFPTAELDKVKTLGSALQGHPDMNKTPGIEVNTGSLGMGLSVALGMGLGLKLDESNSKVYVILGDGETEEGQVWEAAMAAAHYKADNLVAFVDRNNIQATGPVEERMDVGDVGEKFKAFGWNVISINGHKIQEIADALDSADVCKGKPTVVIAHTTKGKYVSFAEGKAAYHNCSLTREQYKQAVSDIETYTCE